MVYQGDADVVILPGSDGEMGILPNHAPLLSTLKYGICKVRSQGQEEFFAISGGVVEVQPDLITVWRMQPKMWLRSTQPGRKLLASGQKKC